MSNNKKILIFSGIGLAVLGGVTAVLMLTAPPKETDGEKTPDTDITEQDSALMLSDRLVSDVKSVEIKNKDDSFSITPDGESWTVADIASAPLDTAALKSAVESASIFEAKEFAEETDDLGKYGLDAPKASVKVNFSDDSSFSFDIGNDVPNSSSAVYMTPDGKNVYTCYKSDVNCFSNSRFGFVDTTAMPAYDQSEGEEVKRVTVERSDLEKPLVIESIKPEDESAVQVYSYRMTSPYTAYADLQDAPNFMYSIFGLKASRAEWVGLDEKDYELSGMNDPTCVITTQTNKKTYTLKLGKGLSETTTNEDGSETTKITGVYGISSEVPDVLYVFDVSDIPALSVVPDRLISRLFLMPYIYSLESVSYSDKEGTSFSIDIKEISPKTEEKDAEYKLLLSGKDFDEQHIKDMYQYLISASGDELYFDKSRGGLIAEITYTYRKSSDGVNGKDIVALYQSPDDRKVIISLNGENLFKTRQIYTEQLLENAKKFISGQDIVLTY